jgi:hypothetical protein
VCTQHVTREPIKRFISSDEGARLAENLSVIIAGDIKKIVKSVKTWGLQCDEVVGDERDYINMWIQHVFVASRFASNINYELTKECMYKRQRMQIRNAMLFQYPSTCPINQHNQIFVTVSLLRPSSCEPERHAYNPQLLVAT